MARREVTITSTWEAVSDRSAMITILDVGKGVIMFNDVAVDPGADKLTTQVRHGKQIQQTSNKSTYVRATGTGWVVAVDD